MKKIISIISIVIVVIISACNDEFMDRFPQTSIGTENFFKSEEDLKMYLYSLYSFDGVWNYTDDGYQTSDNMSNTGATEIKNIMLSDNPSSKTVSGGWNWDRLRNINLFNIRIGIRRAQC